MCCQILDGLPENIDILVKVGEDEDMGDLFEGRVVLGESKFVTLHSLRVLEVDIAHYKHHLNILDQAISDCK